MATGESGLTPNFRLTLRKLVCQGVSHVSGFPGPEGNMALRKSLAALLSALMLTLGAPIVGMAQTQGSTLRGQVVDAGGRGSAGMRVELVSDRMVVSTTISGPDGHFSFSAVPANNYIVRTTVNGQPSGVRVSVVAGQQAQHALIVLPSVATASPAVIAVVGLNGLVTL